MFDEAPDVEVFCCHVGTLDTAPDGGRREPILIRRLSVGAEEARQADAVDAANVFGFVCRRQPVRILLWVEETNRARVVARALDVAAEIALPAGADFASAQFLLHSEQETAVAEAGIEDGTVGAVPIIRCTTVRRENHTTRCHPL